MKNPTYKTTLLELQIELVKAQKQILEQNRKLLVIIEGRDCAGKDSTIKRIVAHTSPRETRVTALGKPTDQERSSWYFQRYVAHLPAASEFVLFNRSWYNRAGVEKVMGFCTEDEYQEFMDTVNQFETMLVGSGILLFKYYLDIDKKTQHKRLAKRRNDPLKQWKRSPIDACAQNLWKEYSDARNLMLQNTSHSEAPWTIVDANDKKHARLQLLKHLLAQLEYPDKNRSLLSLDNKRIFDFDAANPSWSQLAP